MIGGSLKTVDTGDLKVIETKTPELANSEWLANGYDKPPYNPNFEVKVVEAGNEKYVRVFSYNADGTSNKLGGWLMKKSDIEGLTPAKIADKYALPKAPTHICDVNVSPDVKLQTGIANSVEGWGNGGGQQFIFSEKIAQVIELEKCVVIRNKYSNEHPTNNLVAYDFSGNKIWEIDDIIKPLAPQTIVSIGKKDCQYISIITFAGLNLVIEAEAGQIVNKK